MEEEAREILRSALTASPVVKGNLADTIQRRFAVFGGLELELPRRDAPGPGISRRASAYHPRPALDLIKVGSACKTYDPIA